MIEGEKVSKKYALQHRLVAKKKRACLVKKFGDKFLFLDSQTSLALWSKANEKGLWHTSYPNSGYTSLVVQGEYNEHLENFASMFADISDFEGFCFPLTWGFTGAIIVKLDELMGHLNDYMFSFEDEIRFFSTDFTKAVVLQGDRSGSGEKLKELSMSIRGDDWLRKWKTGPI